MIIVVEGPDGSGKTVLAHRISKDLKGIYLKSEYRPQERFDLYLYNAITREAEALAPVICDRHPAISESIYGPLFRGGSVFQEVDMEVLLQTFKSLHVIYCRPDADVIRHNILYYGRQMTGVDNKIDELVHTYDSSLKFRSQFKSLWRYDYMQDDYPSVLAHLQTIHGMSKLEDPS